MTLVRDGKLFGRLHYAFVIMACCCLIQAFGMGLVLNCGSLFYVPICNDLGFSRSEIATYMTGYFIGTTLFTPLAGKLLSQCNIRVVMPLASIVLSGSVVAMSFFTQVWQWQVSGFLVGAAGSCIFVLPTASLIGNWFVKRRGFVYGVTMAFASVSSAIFSMVISGIIQTWGWRAGYVFVGVASVAVILPCSLVMRKKPTDMDMVPYGLDELRDLRGGLPLMRGASFKGAVLSAAFWCLFVFAGIAAFIHSGIEQHMPGHIEAIGFTATFAAMVVSAESVGSIIDKLVLGWLNDKIGVMRTTIIELAVVALGIVGFLVFRHPVLLILSAMLFGVQDSLQSVSLPLLIRDVFGSRNYTQIHAWIRTGVGIFGSFAGVVVGGSYDAWGTFAPAFAALAGTCFVGMACVLIAYCARKKLVWTDERGRVCEKRDVLGAEQELD